MIELYKKIISYCLSNRFKNLTISGIFILGFVFSAYSQQRLITVTGVVKNAKNEVLPGVNVLIQGTKRGTSTDIDGKFKLNVYKGNTLIFSSVGFEAKNVKVENQVVINVVLKEKANVLEGVVLNGYRKFRKTIFTGAAQHIEAEDVKIDGIADFSQMLQGRLAGVDVRNVTSTFGSSPRITIRGGASIMGDSNPIWVVDGVVQESVRNVSLNELISGNANTVLSSAISGLSPSDIKSIDVLKDGTATALYGARALNGVIIITTKSGKINQKPALTYHSEYTFRPVPSYSNFDFTNSQETVSIYRELQRKAYFDPMVMVNGQNGGIYNKFYRGAIYSKRDPSVSFHKQTPRELAKFLQKHELANTDWFKVLYGIDPTQSHTLTFTGGGDASSTYASLSFYNDPGITIADNVNRLTGSLKNIYYFNHNKTKITMLLQGSYRDQKLPGTYIPPGYFSRPGVDTNPYRFITTNSRAIRPYDDNGNLEYYRKNWAPFNILNEIDNNYKKVKEVQLKFQLGWNQKLSKSLKYDFLGSLRFVPAITTSRIKENSNVIGSYRADGRFVPAGIASNSFLFNKGGASYPVSILDHGGIFSQSKNSLLQYSIRNSLDFDKMIGDDFRLLAYLGSQITFVNRAYTNFDGYGYQYDKGETIFFNPDFADDLYQSAAKYYGASETRDRNVTFAATSTLSYKDKHVLNLSFTYEGSNRGGGNKDGRWLPTWNVGYKWNVYKEPFLDKKDWLSELAFRVNYGRSALIPQGVGVTTRAVFYHDLRSLGFRDIHKTDVIKIRSLANKDISWEKTFQLNLGLDISLFNNKYNLSLDAYQKKGKDLFDNVFTSGIGGESKKLLNNASLTTKGIELSITSNNISTADFKWTTQLNFSYFSQEITKLAQKTLIRDAIGNSGGNVLGYPRNSIFSYRFTGLDNRGLPTFNFKGDAADQGSTYVIDQGKSFTEDDLEYLGPFDPNFSGGLSNSFSYKNWALSFYITFAGGNKIRLNRAYNIGEYSSSYMFTKEFKNRWIFPGDEKKTNVPVIPSRRFITSLGTTESKDPSITQLYAMYSSYNDSDYRTADAGFVRMKNISLSYRFPKELIKALHLSNFQMTAQVTNPFLIYSDPKLHGQDPEFINSGGVANPIAKQYTLSLDIGF